MPRLATLGTAIFFVCSLSARAVPIVVDKTATPHPELRAAVPADVTANLYLSWTAIPGAPAGSPVPADWAGATSSALLNSSWSGDWKLDGTDALTGSPSSPRGSSLTGSILLVVLFGMTLKWITSRQFYELICEVWTTVSAIETDGFDRR